MTYDVIEVYGVQKKPSIIVSKHIQESVKTAITINQRRLNTCFKDVRWMCIFTCHILSIPLLNQSRAVGVTVQKFISSTFRPFRFPLAYCASPHLACTVVSGPTNAASTLRLQMVVAWICVCKQQSCATQCASDHNRQDHIANLLYAWTQWRHTECTPRGQTHTA